MPQHTAHSLPTATVDPGSGGDAYARVSRGSPRATSRGPCSAYKCSTLVDRAPDPIASLLPATGYLGNYLATGLF